MDCRTTVAWAILLSCAVVGCKTQVMDLPGGSRSVTLTNDKPPDLSQIRKAPTRKDPPLATLIKWGDLNAGEAMSPDVAPAKQQKLRDDARQAYQRALALDPKCAEAYQGLARLCVAVQDFPNASEYYRKALDIAPKNPGLWYELGMSKNNEKDWDAALESLGQAVQLDPMNRDYLNVLAVLLTRVGRVQEGLECFVRACGEAMGNYRLARTLQHLQQPELSRQYLEAALEKDPNLDVAQAMWDELNRPPAQPIQQTSYHQSTMPTAPTVEESSETTAFDPPVDPPPASEPTPQTPRVILLNPPEQNAPEPDTQSRSQTIVVPPPPTINLRYETPSDK